MPSPTSVVLTVRGVDQTRAVFARIRANVGLMAARVRLAAVGAVAGAGALTAAIATAANSLGELSDRAAQAGTTSDELARLTTALAAAGAKGASLETISQALARMTQATGRQGVDGLARTLEEISRIGDEGGRIRALSATFGRAFGPGLAAFVRNGPDKIRASLDAIVAAMPGVRNELAAAGDALADGFKIASDGVLRQTQSLLVALGAKIVGGTNMTARQLGATIGAYTEYYGAIFADDLGKIPRLVGNVMEEAGAVIGHHLREWTGWIGDLVAFAGMGFDFLGHAFDGRGFGQAAEDALGRWRESYEDQVARIRAARKELLTGTDEQRRRLEEQLAAAAKLDEALADLGGNTPQLAVGDLTAALGPLRDAQAVAADSYQAFRIAQQGRGGNAGNTPVDRATLDTAKNTATMARNSTQQTRALEKLAAATTSAGSLYVLDA